MAIKTKILPFALPELVLLLAATCLLYRCTQKFINVDKISFYMYDCTQIQFTIQVYTKIVYYKSVYKTGDR